MDEQEGVGVHSISIKAKGIAWNGSCPRPNLRNIDIVVSHGEKVAICGEVGAGKTTLLAAVLGELPYVDGEVSPSTLPIYFLSKMRSYVGRSTNSYARLKYCIA